VLREMSVEGFLAAISINEINGWAVAIIAYVLLAVLSLIPFIRVAAQRVLPLNPGGPGFDELPAELLDDGVRARLRQNEERILGTLGFWKREAEKYRLLNSYVIFWMIVASTMSPVLTQAVSADPVSRWLLTLVASHAAIMVAVAKAFRVSEQHTAYRQGESDYYDLRRAFLDNPLTFGESSEEQFFAFSDSVAKIRRRVRDAETDNIPSIDDVTRLVEQARNRRHEVGRPSTSED